MKNNELILKFFQFLEKKKGKKTPLKFKFSNQDKFNWSKEDLKIQVDLDLRKTLVTSLPDGLEVGGYLDLESTPIKSLPNNLKVGVYLDLTKTKITSLPDGLEVGGYLYLKKTSITSLPEDLIVRKTIIVDYDKLEYFQTKYPRYDFE